MNGTVTLSWTLVAGANSCGRELSFSVFLSATQDSMPLILNTQQTS